MTKALKPVHPHLVTSGTPEMRSPSSSQERTALSRSLWDQQRYEEAHVEIEAATAAVGPQDVDGHWALHQAYTMGVGELDTPERWRRAFHHLLRAAQVGKEPMLLLKVASHYWGGWNGVERDLIAAHAWLRTAVGTGSEDARVMYADFLRKNKSFGPKS